MAVKTPSVNERKALWKVVVKAVMFITADSLLFCRLVPLTSDDDNLDDKENFGNKEEQRK
ncbi:hypothetical protein E2C01_015344 [Portunus trituberculatus]|uniref:Uncharacterized protein n=1 Tax=Portunus trituberculatus TaxID=210409 RepID=A0A5B7DLA3_PORTR|nr:hypothetical protein [Portunus trituberculatus]